VEDSRRARLAFHAAPKLEVSSNHPIKRRQEGCRTLAGTFILPQEMSYKGEPPRVSINQALADKPYEEEEINETSHLVSKSYEDNWNSQQQGADLNTYPPTALLSPDVPPPRQPLDLSEDRSGFAHRVRYYDHLARSGPPEAKSLASINVPYHIIPQAVLLGNPFKSGIIQPVDADLYVFCFTQSKSLKFISPACRLRIRTALSPSLVYGTQ